MADRLRLYFDQHVPVAVADGLRRRGIDVLTAHDADRCGLPDEAQLFLAHADQRAPVTFDADFLSLAAGGTPHSGIVFCAATKLTVGELIRAVSLVVEVLTPDEMCDHVEFL